MQIHYSERQLDFDLQTALVLLESGLSPERVRVNGMAIVQKPILRLKLGIRLLEMADASTDEPCSDRYRGLARVIGVTQAMRMLVRDYETQYNICWFDVSTEDKAEWLDKLESLRQEGSECLSCLCVP